MQSHRTAISAAAAIRAACNCALRVAFFAALALLEISATYAQAVGERGPASLPLEGYANGTAGRSVGEDGGPDSDRGDARLDAGLRAASAGGAPSHSTDAAARLRRIRRALH